MGIQKWLFNLFCQHNPNSCHEDNSPKLWWTSLIKLTFPTPGKPNAHFIRTIFLSSPKHRSMWGHSFSPSPLAKNALSLEVAFSKTRISQPGYYGHSGLDDSAPRELPAFHGVQQCPWPWPTWCQSHPLPSTPAVSTWKVSWGSGFRATVLSWTCSFFPSTWSCAVLCLVAQPCPTLCNPIDGSPPFPFW